MWAGPGQCRRGRGDVRAGYHLGMPVQGENASQGAGRAAEDARLAEAVAAAWRELWERMEPVARSSQRPRVTAVMVSSLDGRATEGGRVAALTGPADQAILRRLRAEHDAVMVGATTVRVEGYGSLLKEAERAGRQAQGRPAQPLLCIVSGRGRLQADLRAFQARDLPVLVLTASASAGRGLPEHVRVMCAEGDRPGELDVAASIGRLGREERVGSILCEGGPTLLGSLVRADVVDELILTMSPRIEGGDGLRPIADSGTEGRELELRAHAAAGGFVFLRYRFCS